MADNKEYLVKERQNGSILVSDEVVTAIAGAAVSEVEGVAGLSANIGSDIAEMLGMKNLGKGIKLSVTEEVLSITCNVILFYGYDVIAVAGAIQDKVKTAVESMTGFRVSNVDVNVSGISVAKNA